MIKMRTKADMKRVIQNMGDMRKVLGVSAFKQTQELATSACYIAARLSYPADRAQKGGGAKMKAVHKKKQDENIRKAVEALVYDFDPRKSNPEKTLPSPGAIVAHHDQAAKVNGKYKSAKKIAGFYSRYRNASPEHKQTAIRSIQKWAGYMKAAWINGLTKVNKGAKQQIPKYVATLVAQSPSSVRVRKGNGTYEYTITNRTSQSGSLKDDSLPFALIAAARGQMMRYQAQVRKIFKSQFQ